jgi:hypothetical protein
VGSPSIHGPDPASCPKCVSSAGQLSRYSHVFVEYGLNRIALMSPGLLSPFPGSDERVIVPACETNTHMFDCPALLYYADNDQL